MGVLQLSSLVKSWNRSTLCTIVAIPLRRKKVFAEEELMN